MRTVRMAAIAALTLLFVADPALAQRRAPPSGGPGNRGRDSADPPGKRKRRKPPSDDKGWKVRKPVRVDGFSPNAGPPGTQVAIQGKRFGRNVVVKLNGRPIRIVSSSPRELRVVIPRWAVSDHFVVAKPGFADVTTGARFDVVRPPVIRKVRPPRGDVGITIRIRGNNFISSDQVVLNNLALRITSVDPRRITAVIPSGAVTGRLGIRRGGRVVAWSKRPFVVALPPPMITSFSPTSGPAGTVVRLNGRNFDPTDIVQLAGRRLPTRGRGPTFIEVIVRGQSGPFVIRGRGGRNAASPSSFTMIRPPVVRHFAPRFGPPGTQVILRGAGFLRGDHPHIGPAQLTVRTISHNQIVAEIPGGVSTGRIYVRRAGRAYYARGVFKVINTPTIASFAPQSGPLGTVVTLRGSNFMPGASVLLSGRKLRIVQRRFPTELGVRIPPGARTGRFVVVTRGGSAQSPGNFVVQQYASFVAFHPVRGLPGTRVTLRGNFFHPGMKAYLSGRLLPITQVRPRSATVVIPAGVPSGRFMVETYGRRITSRLNFVVEQPRPELSFTFAPPAARRGGDLTLYLTPPRRNVTIYLNGRPLPRRVMQGGRMMIVTVPGDSRVGRGLLEVEHKGRRYKPARPLRIR